jgi:hypothetical protein
MSNGRLTRPFFISVVTIDQARIIFDSVRVELVETGTESNPSTRSGRTAISSISGLINNGSKIPTPDRDYREWPASPGRKTGRFLV